LNTAKTAARKSNKTKKQKQEKNQKNRAGLIINEPNSFRPIKGPPALPTQSNRIFRLQSIKPVKSKKYKQAHTLNG
jgi:hypothetical protein